VIPNHGSFDEKRIKASTRSYSKGGGLQVKEGKGNTFPNIMDSSAESNGTIYKLLLGLRGTIGGGHPISLCMYLASYISI